MYQFYLLIEDVLDFIKANYCHMSPKVLYYRVYLSFLVDLPMNPGSRQAAPKKAYKPWHQHFPAMHSEDLKPQDVLLALESICQDYIILFGTILYTVLLIVDV